MHWLCTQFFIGLVATISLIQFSVAQSQAPEIKEHFEKNWLIHSRDKVSYSRNFNRHREFSYTSCDTSQKYCNVTLTNTKPKNFNSKTCKFDLDPFESTELGVASLLLPDDINPKNLVAVEWYRIGNDHLDSFLSFLNMSTCKSNANHFIGSIDESSEPSHVIMYNYPKMRTSALMRHERRLIRSFSFGQAVQYGKTSDKIYIRVNHSWIGEEQAVEEGASQGFFFLASNVTHGSKVDVMYANLTTNATMLLGSAGNLVDSMHTYPKTSGGYNKYGLCWKKMERDNKVNCTQFEVNGRRSIREIRVQFEESIDWLAVHNLKEPAMLLVTGRCDNNKCENFKVIKLHADGRKSAPFEIKNLNVECPERPLNLSMDIVEDALQNEICFNFVCLDDKHMAEPLEKINTSLQYRRFCISQDYIAQMS